MEFEFIEEAEERAREKPAAGPRCEPLAFLDARSWQDVPIPPRRWLIPNRIPMATTTLLQGDGATGKTTIALQLCVAVDQGTDWLGAVVDESGPSIFFSAEEDEDEIHRRLAAITEQRGISFRDLKAVRALGMPGEDVTLGAPDQRSIIRPTALFLRLEQAACDIRPKLLVIEAAADVFAGNENDRGQVRQFIGLLRGLAKKADAALMLLQHPSLTGMSSGTGNSGSTHWSNGFRSRLYFTKCKANGGDDPEVRQLELMKANYGPVGEVVKLRWQAGVFVLDGSPSTIERAASDATADELFLRCLDAKRSQGIEVVPTPGPSYAPAVFDSMSEVKAKGLKRVALAKAMERLLSAGRIRNERISGPPSRPKNGLVRV